MGEIGLPFKDIREYNSQMSKALEDKLFFISELPRDKYVFVDFGCADGSLISELRRIYGSDSAYIGYDSSTSMIDIAKRNCVISDGICFTEVWEKVRELLSVFLKTDYVPVLILSSVIHEVYSYGGEKDIEEFWQKVLYSGFEYIIVRDMMWAKDMNRHTNIGVLNKVLAKPEYKIWIQDFINKWGALENNKNMVHFLLKYRYRINWTREVNENYFPISIEDFLDKFKSNSSYRLDYFEKFRVKYIEEAIYNDFGVILRDTTHIKAIFRV